MLKRDLDVGPDGRMSVGWLHPGHSLPRGDTSPEFIARLKEFSRRWFDTVESLRWGVTMGYHTCELCGQVSCTGTFGVPAGERLYCCPEMIAHYVERHQYLPPEEFIATVLASPLPGTPEFDIQANIHTYAGVIKRETGAIAAEELVKFAMANDCLVQKEYLPGLNPVPATSTRFDSNLIRVRNDKVTVGKLMWEGSGVVVVFGCHKVVDEVVARACGVLKANFERY